ncbi:SixA phosphatase family protein [Xanthomarina spongicola]|uniref:Phosphohistidine phosphatase n=1 Tax=Xanthomarina spongicola TaxID=570520 RepID=A0A316DHJ5_9FLAO|nr:histidine phosphatase family protein [Xanthomarina spongicola]PWK17156.1 phosphohistidine phosphatase [Xanthomarina spongicola]
MKKLIIVRHAKSSWVEQVSDHDRGLKARGLHDSELVSLKFKELHILPDIALSSTAKRARNTAEIFINNLNIDRNKFSLDENIYDFSGESLIKTIKNVDNTINTLMLFGHNHALTYFVNSFGDRYIDNVPTSGLVVIDFHIDSWKYIKKGHTTHIIFPRDLR